MSKRHSNVEGLVIRGVRKAVIRGFTVGVVTPLEVVVRRRRGEMSEGVWVMWVEVGWLEVLVVEVIYC